MFRVFKIYFFISIASLLIGSVFFVASARAELDLKNGDVQKVLLLLNNTLDKFQNDGRQKCLKHEDRGGLRNCSCTVETLNAKGKDKVTYNLLFCNHSPLSNKPNYVRFGTFKERGEIILDPGIFVSLLGNYRIVKSFNDLDIDPALCELSIGSTLASDYQVKQTKKCAVEVSKKPDGCICSAPGKTPGVIGFDGILYATNDEKGGNDKNISDVVSLKTPVDDDILAMAVEVYTTMFGVPQAQDPGGLKLQISQSQAVKNSMCPHFTGATKWNCSQPAYKESDRCCCTEVPEGQGSSRTQYDCKPAKGFEFGGKCGGTDKQFPIPKSGSCHDPSIELQGEIDAETPGISVEKLLNDAKGLNELKNFSGPAQLIGQGIRIILSFIGSIALILYIFAGFLWMTAAGNPERITTARNIIIWATLGVAVMLGSYIIVQFLFGTVLNVGNY